MIPYILYCKSWSMTTTTMIKKNIRLPTSFFVDGYSAAAAAYAMNSHRGRSVASSTDDASFVWKIKIGTSKLISLSLVLSLSRSLSFFSLFVVCVRCVHPCLVLPCFVLSRFASVVAIITPYQILHISFRVKKVVCYLPRCAREMNKKRWLHWLRERLLISDWMPRW